MQAFANENIALYTIPATVTKIATRAYSNVNWNIEVFEIGNETNGNSLTTLAANAL